MNFSQQKAQFFKKPDKSLAKGIDRAILPLIRKINSKKDYFTTSSCAGRIILIKETGKKQEKVFLQVWHEKVNFEEIKKALAISVKKYKGMIYLKHEPCIMHVACASLRSAQQLVNMARHAGWKKSGIISRKNIIEMFSTEILAVPVADKGNVLISDSYLKIIVSEANKKLVLTRQKIKKLEKLLK